MIDLEEVNNISFFKDLDIDETRRVLACGSEKEFVKGAVIFHEGTSGNSFFVICKGKVRASKNLSGLSNQKIFLLEAGDYLGQTVLFRDFPRYFSAIAETDVQLIEFYKDDFNKILEGNMEIAYKILWHFCKTLSNNLKVSTEKFNEIFSGA